MATKAKSVKENSKAADTLKKDKEEKVQMKHLLRDERTHKIAGSICILFAILFFIAFTSYLFTWDEDQDKVFKEGYKLYQSSQSDGYIRCFYFSLFYF
jgi:S-DNA-T family DNA segregation ATPase FtsK/SpoIIIE